MRTPRFSRTVPLTGFLLVVAAALLIAGVPRSAVDRASADTTYNPFGPFLLAAKDHSPADGATGVAANANISVSFNHSIRASSLNQTSFYLTEGSSATHVPATVTYSASTKKATLNPTTDLNAGTTYHATLTTDIRSDETFLDSPWLSNAGTWSFTTDTAPRVVTSVPAAGATGVPVDQKISITFDKEMRSPVGMSLKKVGGSGVGVAVARSDDKRTLLMWSISPLEAGTPYQITLTDSIKSQSGFSIQPAPFVLTFTTAGGEPALTETVPTDGATGVALDQTVSATFDRNMDASTLTGATFSIAKSGGATLPATVLYNGENKTATLDPSALLEANTAYTVTLTGAVRSSSGQALTGAPKTWSFTTVGGGDSGGGDSGDGGVSGFTDVVPGVTPYATAIAELAARGVSTGFPDGTFRPNDLVTRQQFAKMIVLTLEIDVTGAEICPFTDVPLQVGTDPLYPSKYVAVCAQRGITVGRTPTTFAPNDNITHQQLITMIVRAGDVSSPPASFTTSFGAGQFSIPEHYQNARKAANAGLLDGLLGVGPSYSFLAGSSRGECAQLLYNLIGLLGL